MQRVISLRFVTQIAFLEEYGFFILLADKVLYPFPMGISRLSLTSALHQSLYAIHIESLVHVQGQDSRHPAYGLQRLSGPDRHVHFFSVGNLNGRTLVIYMKKKGVCLLLPLQNVRR